MITGHHRGHPTLIYEIKHTDGTHEDMCWIYLKGPGPGRPILGYLWGRGLLRGQSASEQGGEALRALREDADG